MVNKGELSEGDLAAMVNNGEMSEGECEGLLGRQEEGEQTTRTRSASVSLGRHLHIPAVAIVTLLAAGIVFLGGPHMPSSAQVTSEYFGVLTEDNDSDANSSDLATTTNTDGAKMVRKGETVVICEDLALLKVRKVLHNNFGGMGPDQGEEGIFYEVGVDMTDKFGTSLTDVTGNVVIHATSTFHSNGKNTYNGVHGDFMSIALRAGTNVSFTIGAYDPETNASITLPYFSITFFDLDEGPEHHGSEFVIAKDFEHYYVAKDSQVKVTQTEDGATMFHGTEKGTGADNPTESEALAPLMKSKGVTLSYFWREEAEFTIGAEAGSTVRGFNFVLRPSMVCAKTLYKGVLEDPLNTSIPGVELPLLDGKEAVAGMVVPDFDIILPEMPFDANETDFKNIKLCNITFEPGDESGSPTWRLGGLCALVAVAAAQWASHA